MVAKIVGQSGGERRISIEVIEAVLEALDKLEAKPKPKLSQDEKLFNLRDKIKRVVQLGYSYDEISFVLNQQGINIATPMLRSYFSQE